MSINPYAAPSAPGPTSAPVVAPVPPLVADIPAEVARVIEHGLDAAQAAVPAVLAPEATAIVTAAQQAVWQAVDVAEADAADHKGAKVIAEDVLDSVKVTLASKVRALISNEPVLTAEIGKIILAAGVEFGAPVPQTYANIAAAVVYTALTFVARRFVTPAAKAEARTRQALYAAPPA